MIITTDKGTYKVVWRKFGQDSVAPKVFIQRKLRIFSFWHYVWDGDSVNAITAATLSPEGVANWFKIAIDRYERNQKAWVSLKDKVEE